MTKKKTKNVQSKQTPHVRRSIVKLVIVLIFISLFLFISRQEIIFQKWSNMTKESTISEFKSQKDSDSSETSSYTLNTSKWDVYTDTLVGFDIRFPQSTSKVPSSGSPVKQWLSESEMDGYRLSLTNDTLGTGKYFMIILKKDVSSQNFLQIWKEGMESADFTFDTCSADKCVGQYATNSKKYTFEIENNVTAGKESITIVDSSSNHASGGRPLFTERIYLRVNPDYIMEINKGSSDIANTILSTLIFHN